MLIKEQTKTNTTDTVRIPILFCYRKMNGTLANKDIFDGRWVVLCVVDQKLRKFISPSFENVLVA